MQKKSFDFLENVYICNIEKSRKCVKKQFRRPRKCVKTQF